MLILMIIYTAYTSKRRSGTFWNKYGPLILVCASFPLIMAEPTRHLLGDQGVLGDWASEYKDNCDTETMKCLSVTGWVSTILCTYIGFTLLVIGSLWNGNIVGKCGEIYAKWKQLRSGEEDGSESNSNSNANDKPTSAAGSGAGAGAVEQSEGESLTRDTTPRAPSPSATSSSSSHITVTTQL